MSSLDQQAAESLAYIRHTMARSAAFTAVPGWGGVAMGGVGLFAAIAASQSAGMTWLAIWLGAAAVAVPVGLGAMFVKAQKHAVPVWAPAGRRFVQAFVPPLAAAAVLTVLLTRQGHFDLVPATWLLLYGAGVMAGATSSVPVLTVIGIAFMVCGVGAAVSPPTWGNLWLGAGFGALHIGFGFVIARKYGG